MSSTAPPHRRSVAGGVIYPGTSRFCYDRSQRNRSCTATVTLTPRSGRQFYGALRIDFFPDRR